MHFYTKIWSTERFMFLWTLDLEDSQIIMKITSQNNLFYKILHVKFSTRKEWVETSSTRTILTSKWFLSPSNKKLIESNSTEENIISYEPWVSTRGTRISFDTLVMKDPYIIHKDWSLSPHLSTICVPRFLRTAVWLFNLHKIASKAC